MFPMTDMWKAQGIVAQMMVLVFFCTLFLIKPIRPIQRNLPLFFLTLWLGIRTGYTVFYQQINNVIDTIHFFPFFNYICILVIYIAVVCFLTKNCINKCIIFIRYTIIAELVLCVLQFFDVSQFFVLLKPHHYNNYSMVVGLLGNGTHLSGFLATTACLFLDRKRENYLILALMLFVMCFTGTTMSSPAINGFVVFFVTVGYYLFKKDQVRFTWFCLICAFLGVVFYYSHSPESMKDFLSFNGRLDIWGYYWNLFKDNNQEITGYGIGSINSFFFKTPYPAAKHLHNEFFHLVFEGGFVLAVLIIYFVKDFFSIKPISTTALKCKTMFLGFLVSSMFNYPGHLWMPSVYAVFSYGALMALERGKNADTDTITNPK